MTQRTTWDRTVVDGGVGSPDPRRLVEVAMALSPEEADMLVADDAVAPPVIAEGIRQEARERLALLDGLAPP